MATNTYVALKTTTLTNTATNVNFDLTGITGYTDLVIVANTIVASGTGYELSLRFNSDTGSNYSNTYMLGTGTNPAVTGRASNVSYADCGYLVSNSGLPNTRIINIMNYSSTVMNKTVWSRGAGQNGGQTIVYANLWRSNNAITSIDIFSASGLTYGIGSTFTVYGIASASATPAPKATGGTIYTDSLYYYHVFGSTGVFTPTQALSCDVLTVAGGGGGGYHGGGGGGAGGLLYSATQSLSNGVSYTATVGAGGAGGNNGTHAANGTNSTLAGSGFTTLTAVGGGGAGGYLATPYTGNAGGSGGGAWGTNAGGAPQSGQGFAGGDGAPGGSYNEGAGGGGGAGAVGQTASAGVYMGAGGVGSSTYNSWSLATGVGQYVSGTYYIAGGGGGGMAGNSNATAGVGGYGGGGAGATKSITLNGTFGTVNTGGGGGGGAYNGTPGTIGTPGSGGSGVLIIRYLKA